MKNYIIVKHTEDGLLKYPENLLDIFGKEIIIFDQYFPTEEAAANYATKNNINHFIILPVYVRLGD